MNMAYRGAALRSAIELGIFTAIGGGARTAREIGQTVRASERGTRIVCDAMTAMGFLKKAAHGRYGLTPDSAAFLDQRSPYYMGALAKLSLQADAWPHLAKPWLAVRAGGSTMGRDADMEVELAEWKEFAGAIAPMMALPAQAFAKFLLPQSSHSRCDVLELAAGHGLFGIALGKRNRRARITALDWPSVVRTAKANAVRAGLRDRFSTIGGSLFDVDYRGPYDLVVIANFVHMLSPEQNGRMFRKALAALRPGGRMALYEFVVNEDRASPEVSAIFAMAMLTATKGGDVYTFSELERMCREAGFPRCELHALRGLEQRVVLAYAEPSVTTRRRSR
jgi:predicted O-methyltransferase YrrM